MTSHFLRRMTSRAAAAAALACLTGACLLDDAAHARNGRDAKRDEVVQSRHAGPPVMAIVSLSRQRVTVYDADGWIMRAPVSSGQSGYETPAGIYSILQRKAEHYSNLYDDAAMPFMQRLTWSGIALHAGALPGYPASHGCVRMPHDFAERLFGVTRLGMRVIVMRDDIGPDDITHPLLFKPASADTRTAEGPSVVALDTRPRPVAPIQTLRMIAAAKAAEVEAAARNAEAARLAAGAKFKEAARANKALRMARGVKGRAEAHVREIESQLENARDPAAKEAAEDAKTKALATLAEAQKHFEAVEADVQPALDAIADFRKAALAAEEARVAAEEEARAARRSIAPISVFISRATQRLYVRQAFQPLFESPVVIAHPDQPLGTYVFTALAYTKGETDMRWNAVSLLGGVRSHARHASNAPRPDVRSTDTGAAQSALDRITIPEDALERISAVISPGSALIVSDEPLSRETGPATEFIVVMSDEPQGGIKIRRREPEARSRYQRFLRHGPYNSGPSFW